MQEGSTAVALAMVTPGYDQDPSSGVADYTNHVDQAQFEADKRAVYKHPLFPLLALLFERCEQATQSSDNSTSESFNMDIQAFVQHQERDRKPFLTNDAEIDGLMIKAIQVLRIHLLELEKVQDLCKDFCNRYITCLKGKMQSENLLRSDYGHHGHDMAPSSGSNGSSPLQVLSSTGNDVESGANGFRVSRVDIPSENGTGQYHHLQQQPHHRLSPTGSCSSSSGHYHNNHHSLYASGSHQQEDSSSPPTLLGSTPLSQIGVPSCAPVNEFLGQGSPSSMLSDEDDDGGSGFAHSGSLDGEPRKKQKRGILPKQATNIMRTWLFQHLVHPYPTEDEKRQIATETNLTLLQVNNWFINARRRILQPMLDGASSNSTAEVSMQQNQLAKQQKSSNPHNSLNSKQDDYWQSEDSRSDSITSDNEISNALIKSPVESDDELH